ncbi:MULTISPECIES: DUF72 domain-containing protein [unclassified Pseudoalteromonas]|uniref:DUF72 domain-containing protein n=2 Tax=Pseudoalteromonas TaxID=53246 RepID=UPI00224AEA7A|nr:MULTISPECIES: DUF72 domain-containing protein [unclassified Pseudoalteromonas]MCX2769270.1 DUF72 domain-containing protein [Pseudoalteromonas sp. B530]
MLYLGCPQWSSAHWKGRVFSSHCSATNMLKEYGQIFNSVEGNTTFYADPNPQTVLKWLEQVPDDFRFTFKIPKRFSHEMALSHCQDELLAWCKNMAPLFPKLGVLMLQLPAQFAPEHINKMRQFLSWLPKALTVGVEIRHWDFYRKGDAERRYNQYLIENNYNRIVMDTRALFSEPASTPAIVDAQQKKPRLPVHAIATGDSPILRFVGCSQLESNRDFYQPWLTKLNQWLSEGKSPYVFFHTADNFDAPFLARQFIADLEIHHQVSNPFPAEKEAKQEALF